MKRTTLAILLLLLAMLAGGLLIAGREGQEKVSQAKPAVTKAEQERLLAFGKKLFVERCAKCHDERGDKPLKSGPPLSERNLSDEEITRTVAGRFRDAPDEEKRAVALYISSLIKRK